MLKKAIFIPTFGLLALCAAGLSAAAPSDPVRADFDAALKGVNFDPATLDANLNLGQSGDGLLDADQMALAAYVINHPDLDLSATGGVTAKEVIEAYVQARTSATDDLGALNSAFPTAADMIAGYTLLGKESHGSIASMTKSFGATLESDYSLSENLGRFFSASGDADGDGVSNADEYRATISGGRDVFVAAALNSDAREGVAPDTQQSALVASADTTKIGILLYPQFEVLDVYGPAEMLSYVPGFELIMVAEQTGAVPSANQGIATIADMSFADAPQFDILLVPGGVGTIAQLENPNLLEFIRSQDAGTEYTTSVCTGSALLAKAGLLDNRKATSNKAAFSLATQQSSSTDWLKSARWVEDGKYFTSSGVSAGTDMALGLIARIKGEDAAKALARSLEYEWNSNSENDPFAIQ